MFFVSKRENNHGGLFDISGELGGVWDSSPYQNPSDVLAQSQWDRRPLLASLRESYIAKQGPRPRARCAAPHSPQFVRIAGRALLFSYHTDTKLPTSKIIILLSFVT